MKINLFYVFFIALLATGLTLAGGIGHEDEKSHVGAVIAVANAPQPPTDDVLTDSTSPLSAPSNLAGTIVSPSQVNLTWASISVTVPVHYRIVRNAVTLAEVISPWFADTTVQSGQSYGYYIQAIDEQGRASQPSNFIVLTVKPVTQVAATTPKPSTTIPKVATPTTPDPKKTAVITPTTTPPPSPVEVVVTPPPSNLTNAIANTNTAVNTNTATNTNTSTNTNTATNTNTSNPQTYTVNVTSAGVFTPQAITIAVGDSITFHYTSSGSEAIIRFTPSTISSFTIDSENRNRTRTFSTAGTYTFTKQDGSQMTGTITVQ